MVTLSPIIVGLSLSMCMVQLSCMFVFSPIATKLSSPRITVPYQTLAFFFNVTYPMMVLFSATKQVLCISGLYPLYDYPTKSIGSK